MSLCVKLLHRPGNGRQIIEYYIVIAYQVFPSLGLGRFLARARLCREYNQIFLYYSKIEGLTRISFVVVVYSPRYLASNEPNPALIRHRQTPNEGDSDPCQLVCLPTRATESTYFNNSNTSLQEIFLDHYLQDVSSTFSLRDA